MTKSLWVYCPSPMYIIFIIIIVIIIFIIMIMIIIITANVTRIAALLLLSL